MVENLNFFNFVHSSASYIVLSFSPVSYRCHNFQYFWTVHWNFRENKYRDRSSLPSTFGWKIWNRLGRPWMRNRIQHCAQLLVTRNTIGVPRKFQLQRFKLSKLMHFQAFWSISTLINLQIHRTKLPCCKNDFSGFGGNSSPEPAFFTGSPRDPEP